MGKHENIEHMPTSAGESRIPPAPEDAAVTPRMALASLDKPKIDTTTTDPARFAAFPIEPAMQPAKVEPASIDAPQATADMDELEASNAQCDVAEAATADATPEAPDGSASPRVSRFTLLAALLALAAALGGMAGALAAYSLVQPGSTPLPMAEKSSIEEIHALKENVVQARVELAALKVALDAGNRSASAQLTRIGERIDRIDRTQAEPAAKLNKAIEALERIARGDITGVTAAQPTAGAASQQAKPSVLEGWLVRDVHRGTALIEGRTGVIEVDQGDVVPGLGRVESIRKQDGRWVVVTSKGTILSPR